VDKDFARGERMMRRPDLQQDKQNDNDQIQQSSQRGRFKPSWAKQGAALDTSDDDVLPPIPAHLKTNAWMKRYSQKDFQLDQTPSSENNKSAQTIAAVPQQQQSAKGSQPQQPSNLPPNQPMLVANAATMGMGEFVMKQIAKRSPGLAAKAAGLSLADGPFPIGEIIAFGLTAWTAYEIYQDWKKYQANARKAQDRAVGSEPLQMSNTSREGYNHVAKRILTEAGRSGDPCKIWEAEKEILDSAIKSTRNKDELKRLNKEKQDLKKAGKQLGCTNTQKRNNEQGGDYGNIK
jgi:hypothetical protein